VINLEREIRTAMRTGKIVIGSKQTLKLVRFGKAKLVIIASNAPEEYRDDILRYAKLSNTPIYIFPGNSWELGAICGKPFMVAALSVVDPGESNIMALVEKPEEEE